MTDPGVYSARRYKLVKMQAAEDEDVPSLVSTWKSLHESTLGTPLPADFPGRAQLIAAGYSATEDIVGATASELGRRAGLNRRTADAAIAAVE